MVRRANPKGKSRGPSKAIQTEEILKCGSDPAYFINRYVKIAHPTKGTIKFNTFPFQDDCLKSFVNNRNVIVNKSRQLGLSTICAAYSLWMALFQRERNILVIATKFETAKLFITKVEGMLDSLPKWLVMPKIKAQSVKYIKFSNGSQVMATPTSKDAGRGYALSLLIIDEAAHVEGIEDLWLGLRPTLSCLAGNTKVFTNKGIFNIADFHKDKTEGTYFPIDDWKVFGKNGLEKLSHGYVSPESETIKLTTKHGYELETTRKHPLWVLSESGGEMRPAEKLVLGDYLRIQLKTNCFGEKSMDPDLAYMLGDYIAEGNMIKGKNHAAKIFIDLGIDPQEKCWNKHTPRTIFTSTKETQCKYLCGLFDGAGSITSRGVLYNSTSKELILETQTLLSNLGFHTNILYISAEKAFAREQISKRLLPQGKLVQSLKDSWQLQIPRSQFSKFASLIGFNIQYKQQKLLSLSEKYNQDDRKLFLVPVSIIKPTIDSIKKKFGKSDAWFRNHGVRMDKWKTNGRSGPRMLTQNWISNFRTCINENGYEETFEDGIFFENILGDFFWDPIVSLKMSTAKTYDFTVPGTHTFIQNGILGSNTGGSAILISTPSGVGTLFHKIWRAAVEEEEESDFFPIELPWTVHPERDQAWFDRERLDIMKAKGERGVAQELLCLDSNTNIVTLDGCKKIKNIKPGDKVLTHKGRYRPVLRTYKHKLQSDETLLAVSTPGNRKQPIYITNNHPVLSYQFKPKKGEKYKQCFRNNIKEGLQPKFSTLHELDKWKYKVNSSPRVVYGCLYPHLNFDTLSDCFSNKIHQIDLKDVGVKCSEHSETTVKYNRQNKPVSTKRFIEVDFELGRLVGLYAAKGHSEPNRIDFVFDSKEKETLGLFVRNYLNKLGCKFYDNDRNYSNCYTVLSNNKFLRKLLNSFVVPGSTRTKFYNMEKVLQTNENFVRGLLAGHFEGDDAHPFIKPLCDKIKVVSKSPKILYQLKTLLSLYGLYPRLGFSNDEPLYLEIDGLLAINPQQRNIYTLTEQCNTKHLLEKPTSESVLVDNQYFAGAIQWEDVDLKSKYGEEQPIVYNIEVAEDNSYIADSLVVHNCSFMASGDTFLRPEVMERIFDRIQEPIEYLGPADGRGKKDLWIWKTVVTGHKYIISADPARGDGDDFAGFHVIDADESEVVAEYKSKIAPDRFGEFLVQVGYMYNGALICAEKNSIGIATAYRLKDLGYPNLYYEKFHKNMYMIYTTMDTQDEIPGLTVSVNNRLELVSRLESVLRNGALKTYSKRLYRELQTFIWKNNKPQAQKGYNDDLIMALAIGNSLFEANGAFTVKSDDMAKALLAGMSVSTSTMDTSNPNPDGTPIPPIMSDNGLRDFTDRIKNERVAAGRTHNYNDPFWRQFGWVWKD